MITKEELSETIRITQHKASINAINRDINAYIEQVMVSLDSAKPLKPNFAWVVDPSVHVEGQIKPSEQFRKIMSSVSLEDRLRILTAVSNQFYDAGLNSFVDPDTEAIFFEDLHTPIDTSARHITRVNLAEHYNQLLNADLRNRAVAKIEALLDRKILESIEPIVKDPTQPYTISIRECGIVPNGRLPTNDDEFRLHAIMADLNDTNKAIVRKRIIKAYTAEGYPISWTWDDDDHNTFQLCIKNMESLAIENGQS